MLDTRKTVLAIALLSAFGCSRDPQKARRQYLESGERYAKKAQYNSAIIQFQNALEYDRGSAETLQRLGEAYLANRQPQEAYAALVRALEADPAQLDTRLNLGRLYLLGGQFKKAEEQAEIVAQRAPENAAAQQVLGASLAGQKDNEGALKAFRKAAELAPNDAASFVNLGLGFASAGNRAEAELSFRKAIEIDPRNTPAHLGLAEMYRRQGQFAEAERVLQAGVDRTPEALDLSLALATVFAAQSKNDAFEKLLERLYSLKKPEVALALGDFFTGRNQLDRSIVEYRRGTEFAPNDLHLKARLVERHLSIGQIDGADRWNSEILRERPKDGGARTAHGRILLARGKVDEAIVEFRQQMTQTKDSAQAHYWLGVAYLRKPSPSQAKPEFQEAVRLEPGLLPARLSLAEVQMTLGDLASAQEVAEATARMYPRNAAARSTLATVLLRRRNFAVAREHLVVARELAPKDPMVLVLVGASYAGERRWGEAVKEFESALTLDPRNAPALSELAGVWVVSGQSAKAIGRVLQHTAAHRDDAHGHLILGSLYRQAREWARAEGALSRAVQLAPDNVPARLQLAGLYQDQGRMDAAIVEFENALKLQPRSASLHSHLGMAYLKKGDPGSAREHFEQALAIEPGSAAIANNLAFVHAKYGGDLDAALAIAQKARELAPDFVNAADTLGWIQYKKGWHDSAALLFEECVRKSPASATYRYHLGMALIAGGQAAKGKGHLETALRMKIDPDDATQAREALAKSR